MPNTDEAPEAGLKRNAKIEYLVFPDERDEMDRLAAARRMSRAQYARAAVLEAMKRDQQEEARRAAG